MCLLRSHFASLLLMGWLLSLFPSPASAREASGMPPGAFLRTPVSGMAALNQQLRVDSRVVSRYSRLLRLSPEMVRATFAQLHLTYLHQDRMLEVYYVHAGERIGAKVRRVRKGTAVFALPDETPVLAQVCGNPVRVPGTVSNPVTMLPSEGQSNMTDARMAVISDVPDFDPTEPLNSSTTATVSHSITLRDSPPSVETLAEPTDALASDEIPADVLAPEELMPSLTLPQAKRSLEAWVAGGAALVLGGVLGTPRPLPGLLSTALPVREPLNPPPAQGGPRTPTPFAATPEPSGIALTLALVTASGSKVILRRKKQNARA